MSDKCKEVIEAASDVVEGALRCAPMGSPEFTNVSFFWVNRLQSALGKVGITFARDGTKSVRLETIHEKYARLTKEER